jgi:hypothetical protein
MKLRKKYFIVVNICIGLIGVVFIFWGITNSGDVFRPMMEAIGVGLIAAGAVNILDRGIVFELPPPPPEQVQRIEVVANKRIATPQDIFDKKYSAPKVDIIGISLTHVFEELVNDPAKRLIDQLLKNNLQLRLFFVHPDSKYLEQRAIEDRRSLSELKAQQKRMVELSKEFYEQLHTSSSSYSWVTRS